MGFGDDNNEKKKIRKGATLNSWPLFQRSQFCNLACRKGQMILFDYFMDHSHRTFCHVETLNEGKGVWLTKLIR